MAKKQELVNWEEKLGQQAKEVAKLERPNLSRISFKSGIMSYMDEAIPSNELEIVVVAYAIERLYYDTPYEADVVVPPACFALSHPHDGAEISPHEVVPNPVSEICATCPNDKWGSAEGNRKGKACTERRRLVSIPKSAVEDPSKIATAEMALISIPVTSIGNWKKYVNVVSAQTHRPYWAVSTMMRVKPDPKKQFVVSFENTGILENEALGPIENIIPAAEAYAMTPYDMQPTEEEPAERSDKF